MRWRRMRRTGLALLLAAGISAVAPQAQAASRIGSGGPAGLSQGPAQLTLDALVSWLLGLVGVADDSRGGMDPNGNR